MRVLWICRDDSQKLVLIQDWIQSSDGISQSFTIFLEHVPSVLYFPFEGLDITTVKWDLFCNTEQFWLDII